ncbi:MAG: hypothetical protein L6R42_002805 [Xanthoria sp. 1 TBL-2021]|nr:MAG: hypothetical protein L6R42_002805 [Xanthoria sp. 1 TBL-2021]
MTSRGCGTNAIPPEGDDQDLPAARDASPAKTSTRQTRGSVAANNKSATFAKPKSTTSSTARLEPSEKPLHDGNILERLGRFPGLSPPRLTTEDEEEDESDHSVTQEQDLPRPTQAVTKYQRSNNTVAKSSTNRRQNSKKEVKGKIIAAVDLELQYIGPDKWLWGSGIPATAKRLQWFKLELEPDTRNDYSRLEDGYPDERAARRTRRQTPETLTRDYLTSLRIHFEHMLSKVLGAGSLATTPIEYVLTVPAIWTDLAKSRTKACAEEAGMGPAAALKTTSEPEAAAVWAFHEMASYGLEKGDTFVVCDAGGGTVDLITYEILALSPSLRIVEVAKGEGGMCGSTMLDRRFASFLIGKFGSHEMWSESLLQEAKTTFKNDIKTGFTGCKKEEWDVPVPGLSNSTDDDPDRIRHSRYSMKGSDIHDIFEPVIQEIINLVRQQIELSKDVGADIKAVIMVGGFGENLYLYERLRKVLARQQIEVRMSPQAWTAVVRGALIRGLENAKSKKALGTVAGRIARSFYGTECAREYERSKHRKSERYVREREVYQIKYRKVAEKKPIHSHYHVERPVPRPPGKKLEPVKITIVKCDDDKAPTIVGKGQVREIARLEVPLNRLPKKNFEIRHGQDGQQWYIIDFALRATCHSAETYYDLMYKGKNYGRVIAEYV